MRAPISSFIVAALLAPAAARAQCGPPDEAVPAVRESLLVSTRWLAAHRRDPDLAIVKVEHRRGSQASAEVIPGSRVADAMAFTVGSFDLPPVATLDSLVESLGISNTTRVVLYGDPWVTGWMYFVLDYLGHGDLTAILDGGLEQWRAERRPVGAAGRPARATFTPRVQPGIVVDAAWLRTRLRDAGIAVLDVRSADEYAGRARENLPRTGHIPGAALLEWSTAFERPAEAEAGRAAKLRPAAELQTMFRRAGVLPGTTTIVYCTIGMRASQAYFILKYLGYNPKLYDGSWSDWSRRSELPITTGNARGTP